MLKPPVGRGHISSDQFISMPTSGSDLKTQIKADLKELAQQFGKKRLTSIAAMERLKNNYSAFNKRPVSSSNSNYDLLDGWSILLSPQMFYQFGENIKEWESIIEKSAWNMADRWHNALWTFTDRQLGPLCSWIQKIEIDMHYLNWLCDLYYTAPQFLQYALLAILQMVSEHYDYSQLEERLKSMLMSYPLSPKQLEMVIRDDVDRIELSRRCKNFVKTIAMSHSLLDRLSQHRIDRQLHHQPVGNSTIIPEKLMSGEAAFLNVSKSTS